MSRARHHHKRESGGRTHEWVSGNPDVKKEAEHEGEGGSGNDERANGGFVKVKAHKRKLGGSVLGKAPKPRLDRKRGGHVPHHGHHHSAGPIEAHMGKHHGHVMTAHHHKRARGGGVGSDKSPMSSAHTGHASDGKGSSSPADTYGGEKAD